MAVTGSHQFGTGIATGYARGGHVMRPPRMPHARQPPRGGGRSKSAKPPKALRQLKPASDDQDRSPSIAPPPDQPYAQPDMSYAQPDMPYAPPPDQTSDGSQDNSNSAPDSPAVPDITASDPSATGYARGGRVRKRRRMRRRFQEGGPVSPEMAPAAMLQTLRGGQRDPSYDTMDDTRDITSGYARGGLVKGYQDGGDVEDDEDQQQFVAPSQGGGQQNQHYYDLSQSQPDNIARDYFPDFNNVRAGPGNITVDASGHPINLAQAGAPESSYYPGAGWTVGGKKLQPLAQRNQLQQLDQDQGAQPASDQQEAPSWAQRVQDWTHKLFGLFDPASAAQAADRPLVRTAGYGSTSPDELTPDYSQPVLPAPGVADDDGRDVRAGVTKPPTVPYDVGYQRLGQAWDAAKNYFGGYLGGANRRDIPLPGGQAPPTSMQDYQQAMHAYMSGANAQPQHELTQEIDSVKANNPDATTSDATKHIIDTKAANGDMSAASASMEAMHQRYNDNVAHAVYAAKNNHFQVAAQALEQAQDMVPDGKRAVYDLNQDGSVTATVSLPGGRRTQQYNMTPGQFVSYAEGLATSYPHVIANGVEKNLQIASSVPAVEDTGYRNAPVPATQAQGPIGGGAGAPIDLRNMTPASRAAVQKAQIVTGQQFPGYGGPAKPNAAQLDRIQAQIERAYSAGQPMRARQLEDQYTKAMSAPAAPTGYAAGQAQQPSGPPSTANYPEPGFSSADYMEGKRLGLTDREAQLRADIMQTRASGRGGPVNWNEIAPPTTYKGVPTGAPQPPRIPGNVPYAIFGGGATTGDPRRISSQYFNPDEQNRVWSTIPGAVDASGRPVGPPLGSQAAQRDPAQALEQALGGRQTPAQAAQVLSPGQGQGQWQPSYGRGTASVPPPADDRSLEATMARLYPGTSEWQQRQQGVVKGMAVQAAGAEKERLVAIQEAAKAAAKSGDLGATEAQKLNNILRYKSDYLKAISSMGKDKALQQFPQMPAMDAELERITQGWGTRAAPAGAPAVAPAATPASPVAAKTSIPATPAPAPRGAPPGGRWATDTKTGVRAYVVQGGHVYAPDGRVLQ